MNNSNLKWDASPVFTCHRKYLHGHRTLALCTESQNVVCSRLVLGVALEVMDGLWRWKCPFASTRTKFFEVDDKSQLQVEAFVERTLQSLNPLLLRAYRVVMIVRGMYMFAWRCYS